jgi:hypothetical protein
LTLHVNFEYNIQTKKRHLAFTLYSSGSNTIQLQYISFKEEDTKLKLEQLVQKYCIRNKVTNVSFDPVANSKDTNLMSEFEKDTIRRYLPEYFV